MVPKQYSSVENGNGRVGTMGRSLNVNFEKKEWSIRISRTDRQEQEDDEFFSLDQKKVTPDKICEFVPNWEELDWKHAGFKGISKEVFIQDCEYKLYLVLLENASISTDDAIKQFRGFMGK